LAQSPIPNPQSPIPIHRRSFLLEHANYNKDNFSLILFYK
jgi:hypothetical protein